MNQNGNGKSKLLEFFAPWCAPCRAMRPAVESALDGTDIELIDINVDEDPDSARKYEVRAIPTLILIKDEEIGRLVGGVSLDTIKEFLSRA